MIAVRDIHGSAARTPHPLTLFFEKSGPDGPVQPCAGLTLPTRGSGGFVLIQGVAGKNGPDGPDGLNLRGNACARVNPG
jgi:hypothetical protein